MQSNWSMATAARPSSRKQGQRVVDAAVAGARRSAPSRSRRGGARARAPPPAWRRRAARTSARAGRPVAGPRCRRPCRRPRPARRRRRRARARRAARPASKGWPGQALTPAMRSQHHRVPADGARGAQRAAPRGRPRGAGGARWGSTSSIDPVAGCAEPRGGGVDLEPAGVDGGPVPEAPVDGPLGRDEERDGDLLVGEGGRAGVRMSRLRWPWRRWVESTATAVIAGRGHVAAGHGEVGGEVPREPHELARGGEGADGPVGVDRARPRPRSPRR